MSKSKRNNTTVTRYTDYCISARHGRENAAIARRQAAKRAADVRRAKSQAPG